MKVLNKSIAMALIFAMLFTLCPVQLNASYVPDKSDELPGMYSLDDPVIIIAGAVIVTGLVYLVVKSAKKKKAQATVKLDDKLKFESNKNKYLFPTELNKAYQESPVKLFIGIKDNTYELPRLSQNRITVGVKIRI